ncbi:MAG TPA: TIGR01777 family oxidoreductase [Bacteroidota bacterium]|nr:TIGR01777 family oxidoreductase [Bacteroidota bacterium]
MKVVVAGGTGFIGTAVAGRLAGDGHDVVVLSRNPGRAPLLPGVRGVDWDGVTPGAWTSHVADAAAVVNLAGASIGEGRWTPQRKREILESRVQATRALIDAMARGGNAPRVFISASAVGYYGPVDSGDVTEDHPPGFGFLADVCVRWEQEALAAGELGARVVLLRTGVVLGRGGGALPRMMLPFRLFAGGPVGSGKQAFPWVHRDDVAGVVAFALSRADVSGPINLAAPECVDMRAFCAALGRAISRPSWLPVPSFALRAALGEMAGMILTGQRVIPARLTALGYTFTYPTLFTALQSVV